MNKNERQPKRNHLKYKLLSGNTKSGGKLTSVTELEGETFGRVTQNTCLRAQNVQYVQREVRDVPSEIVPPERRGHY
ncbi:hypothetical protein CEXT_63741 [Caerostris extrusa]|uniref:Uncharacterized protein n=1 Tax=Caerostris extrusa TaxID=172846 RepID=A0AAV4TZ23_CAEEX|nr:hypothetical protein CEXT_63741 [Caerostris extrusa]